MSKRRLTPEEAKAWSRVAKSIKRIGPETSDFEALVSAVEAGEPANLPRTIPATTPSRRPGSGPAPPAPPPPAPPA
ncbi:MAG: hypothetical protein ACI93G_000661, partial [Hyphomonas sp.]